MFASATVSGDILTVTFGEALAPGAAVVAGSAFTVTATSWAETRTTTGSGTAGVEGAAVTVRLAKAAAHGETLTVAYTPPEEGPVRDLEGNEAAAFSDEAVTNLTPVFDHGAPRLLLTDAAIKGEKLTLAYNYHLHDRSLTKHAARNFEVKVNGNVVDLATPRPVKVSTSKVVVTLAAAVSADDTVTVSYTSDWWNHLHTVTYGHGYGYLYADDFTDLAVPNISGDATAPTLSAAVVDRTALTLTFDEQLDPDAEPPASAFSVTVNGNVVGVRAWSITTNGQPKPPLEDPVPSIIGRSVLLTLSSSVDDGAAVAVAYEPPGSGTKLRDVAGNAVAGFAYTRVGNRTEVSHPSFRSASANGSTLTVTFTEPLDEDSVAAGSTFRVMATPAEGAARNIAGTGTTSVEGAVVSVSLAEAVVHGEVLMVAYGQAFSSAPPGPGTRPTPSPGAWAPGAPAWIGPIRDLAGKRAAAFSGESATNNTPDTSKPTLESASVDGPTLTLTFDKALDTSGLAPASSAFSVAGTAAAASVVSVSFHGTDATKVELTLSSAVEYGESDLTVDYAKPEADPLADASANEVDDLTSQPVTNDTPAPTRAALVSDPGADATYALGEKVQVSVTFAEAVAVDTTNGTPRLKLDLDEDEDTGERWAVWEDGSGTDTLTFAWEAAAADESTAGIAVPADTLELNGGTIVSVATQEDAALGHAGLAHDPAHKVDAAAPELLRGEVDGGTMTLHFSEALDPGATGGRFIVDLSTRGLVMANFDATGAVAVEGNVVTVGLGARNARAQVGLLEGNRVLYIRRADGAGGALRDLAGNLVTAPHVLPIGDGVEWRYVSMGLANVTGPSVTEVVVVSDAGADRTYGGGDKIRVAVTFDVPVDVTGTPRLKVDMDPAQWGEKWAAYESGTGTSGLTFVHTVGEPNLSTQGIAVLANTLELNGGTIRTGAVDANLVHDGLGHDANHKVDWRTQPESGGGEDPGGQSANSGPPSVTGVSVVSSPGSGDTYFLGETIHIRVTFSEAVTVTGSPKLSIDMDPAHWGEKQATYAGGGGTSSLTFVHEVVEPNYSTQGIAVLVNSLILGGGTIKSAGSQMDAVLGHTGLGHDSGHKVDWRPDISVADAQANEGAGANVAFEVSLSRAFTTGAHRVTVDYATADGGAKAGEDYTATSGTLTFAPGEKTKTVNVPVLDDAVDEGEETFVLRLTNATGARIADGEATGTITNDDPLQKMWLSRFGRTVAGHVTDAVSDRLGAPLTGAQVTVGGESVDLARTEDSAALAQTLTGLARVLGASESPAPEDGAWPETGLGRVRTAVPGSEQARGKTDRELLLGSAFHLAREGGGTGPDLAAWGRVTLGGFDAEAPADEGEVRLDGEVTTGILGADAEWKRLLAGVAISVSEGEGTFDQPGVDSGTVESTLTTVSPYARLMLSDRVSAWGLVGIGTGDMTIVQAANDRGQSERVTRTDLGMRLGAVGGRGMLLDAGDAGGMDLALKADAFLVETESAPVSNEEKTTAEASRVRLILEGSRPFETGGGGVLTPGLELGLRHDGGDAEAGTGVELGGRVSYAAPGSGLSMEASVRMLVAHEASGYEEWGASGSIRLAPGASGRGLSFSLAPAWGAPSSGVDRLWSARDARGLAPDAAFEPESRLDAEFGYGHRVGGAFTGTPYAGLGLSGSGRDYRLGWRLGRAGARSDFSLNLEGTRRESADDAAPAEHGVLLTGEIRW